MAASSVIDADAASSAVPWGVPRFDAGAAPKTVDQLEAVVRAAREEGYAEGRAQGYADGSAEAERLAERFAALIESLSQPLAQLDDEVESALAALACAVAHAALGVELERDPELFGRILREALSAAAGESRILELRVHASDVERAGAALANLGGIAPRLIADAALEPGDVRVHTDSLRIDATLGTRLRAAAAALRVRT